MTNASLTLQLQNGRACELLLQLVGADYYTEFIPEFNTISHSLTYPKEISQQEVEDELIFTRIDEMKLRCSKAQFTAAEDNLVLRGVVSDCEGNLEACIFSSLLICLVFILPTLENELCRVFMEKKNG